MNLTPRIEIKQAVHLGVHEPEHDLGGSPEAQKRPACSPAVCVVPTENGD